MSEMVDRIAAALSAHLEQLAEGSAYFADGYSDGTVVFDGDLDPQALVRQLLTAMREPTPAVLAAAEALGWSWRDDSPFSASDAGEIWRAMIDAALKTA